MTRAFFAGLDLGKKHDFTALTVVERVEIQGEREYVTYGFRKTIALRLRYEERIPLGTEYVEIVARMRRVMELLALQGSVYLAVDATGVGAPVVELLRGARMACRLLPVTITGGDTEGFSGNLYRVPKGDLVAGLQVLFEQGALQISEGLRGTALVKELSDMRMKMTNSGRERFEAGGSGQHDDLVSALSLACWAVRKIFGGGGVGERRGRVV